MRIGAKAIAKTVFGWSIKNIFLLLLAFLIASSVFYIYVYPWPTKVKISKAELAKLHEKRMSYIEEGINKARQQQKMISARVYGASPGPVREEQAEKDELMWKEQLVQEEKQYYKEISDLEKFPPLSPGEFFGFIGVCIGLLGLHFHRIREKKRQNND